MHTNLPSLSKKQEETKKYGFLPPELAEATPWDKLYVPTEFVLQDQKKRKYRFNMKVCHYD
jgi:hypothetical protein